MVRLDGQRRHPSIDVWEVTLEHDLDVDVDEDPSAPATKNQRPVG